MRISDVMTSSPHCVSVGDTLQTAAEIMSKHDTGSVLVLDGGGSLAGIITDRDICLAAADEARALDKLPLAPYMSSTVHCCRATDDVAAAAELMRTHRVRRLVVMAGDDGQPTGIVTLDDLAHARGGSLSGDEIAQTLAAVARRRAYG